MATTYKKRCNDPEAKAQWEASGLVELRTLRPRDVFESIDGTFWQFDHFNHTGTVHAFPWGRDAEPTDFVASAMVRPVMRKTFVSV